MPDRRARALVKDFAENSVFYSRTHRTTGSVTVTIRANDYLAPVSGWTLPESKLRLTKVFHHNASEQVQLYSESGDELQSIAVHVGNIVSH